MTALAAQPKKARRLTPLVDEPQTSAPPPVIPDVAVRMVPIDDIDASPRNPRKDFDTEAIDDLAADIAVNGVLQAIGVRPEGPRLVIVWGERRCRAAKKAGLKEIPAKVGSWDDRTADCLRFSENKHESLSVLELAQGYAELIERHSFSVAQLAVQLKRSEASVRDALVLNKLNPFARRAFNEKLLNASTAMLVAHLPVAVQTSVLHDQAQRIAAGGDPYSFRELRELIAKDHVIDLEGARFELHDAELRKDAGACTGCKWNEKGSCRNVPCFRSKEDALLERWRKNGRKVLTEAQAAELFPFGGDRPISDGDYVLADDVDGYDTSDDTWREKLGKDAQKHLVVARTPAGELVDLLPAAVLPKRKPPEDIVDEDDEPEVDREKAKRAAAKEEREREVRRETAESAIRSLVDRLDSPNIETKLLRVLAFVMCADMNVMDLEDLRARLALKPEQTAWGVAYGVKGAELRAGVLQIALAGVVRQSAHGLPDVLREACGMLGVHLDGIEKKTRERLKKARSA